MPYRLFLIPLFAFLLIGTSCGVIEDAELSPSYASLEAGFRNPPAQAKPRVWWHWMNGNITQEGIAKDLEWMARVGIGGVQNFDAAMETPVVVNKRLSFMSDEWQEAMRYAVKKADSLGLEFAIASSPGWSLTGGPWVAPEDAMKKLVWSQQVIEGGARLDVVLPQPPAIPGPFQDLPAQHKHAHNPEALPESFYRDAVVLAYPLDSLSEVTPAFTYRINGEAVDSTLLIDSSLTTGIDLPKGQGRTPASIELISEVPQTLASARLHVLNMTNDLMRGPMQPVLQVQEAPGQWRNLAVIEPGTVPTTVSFEPVTGSHFRLLFQRGRPSSPFSFVPTPGIDPTSLMGLGGGKPAKPLLVELQLFSHPKVHAFEAKAAFRHVDDYVSLDKHAWQAEGISPQRVQNISRFMSKDGRLRWTAPEGRWKILRLGYSLTGKTNSPATLEATGLEVDKFDSAAVERYLEHYLAMYKNAVGADLFGVRGLNALLTDSAEARPANWTPDLIAKFTQRRGYDPIPWLPVLTGEVVANARSSDRFLSDFRRTLAELNAEEHYGTIARVAKRYGLTVYGEALESNRQISPLGDDLDMRRYADIPMAAMWSFGKGGEPSANYVGDMRGAASVAHIYGKPLVAAESLTSILAPWAHGPAELQPMIDAEFLNGINRPVIHTSPHQPVDTKVPGLSLHVFGQYFTRHETWAEMAKPWIDYLSRNSFLLQQGKNVADVAYLYGEDMPLGVLSAAKGFPEDVPQRYAYDFVSAHALQHEFSVDKGDLVTRGGARYKMLYIGEHARQSMSVAVLEKLRALVTQGATLVGLPPETSPGLQDDESRFNTLVSELWSVDKTMERKGRVIASKDIEDALLLIGVRPDVETVAGDALPFVHRRLENGDVYFVANRSNTVQEIRAAFRVTGKAPSLWRAIDGRTRPAAYRMTADATHVDMKLEPWESVFVVFIDDTTEAVRDLAQPARVEHEIRFAPWQVVFQKERGAPDTIRLPELQSLSTHDNPGVRYFSGVATYTTTLEIPDNVAEREPGVHTMLELGEVGDIAEVYVNGHYAGTVWKSPYSVEVSELLQPGNNQLVVKVANLWVNRLIGDRQPGADKVTYTTFNTYLPNAPLRPSGLIGPLQLAEIHRSVPQ